MRLASEHGKWLKIGADGFIEHIDWDEAEWLADEHSSKRREDQSTAIASLALAVREYLLRTPTPTKLRRKSTKPARDKSAITYAMFGIDPADFYATKFASGRLEFAAFNDRCEPATYRFTFLQQELDRLLPLDGTPLRMLDIGCGSGRFGGYLKVTRPGIELTGLELSAACEPD